MRKCKWKIRTVIFFLSFFITLVCPTYGYDRIVSLGPFITESIYILGAEDKLVGVTVYCKRPPQAVLKPKIGSVIDVNIEKIIELKPDLIIATPLTNPQDIDFLMKNGIKVVKLPVPENFEDLCKEFLFISTLVGKEEKAIKIVDECKRKVNKIKIRKKDSRVKVFVQLGVEPLYTASGETFINDYIKFAGGENIAEDGQGIFSIEQVIVSNPDVILVVDMGDKIDPEKFWERYPSLKAVRNHRIYKVDSYKICSPTPISFVEMLKKLVQIFHEDNRKVMKDEER